MAATVRVDVNDFYSALMETVAESVDRNQARLEADVRDAARAARDELRGYRGPYSRSHPQYGPGWRQYDHRVTDGHVRSVVANASAPGLTHLIEFGHELFFMGRDTNRRTRANPHIRRAYENAARQLRGATGA